MGFGMLGDAFIPDDSAVRIRTGGDRLRFQRLQIKLAGISAATTPPGRILPMSL